MTTAELIKLLAALPGDTLVVIDVGIDWIEPAVQVDDLGGGISGVRLVADEHDIESAEIVEGIRTMMGSPDEPAQWTKH